MASLALPFNSLARLGRLRKNTLSKKYAAPLLAAHGLDNSEVNGAWKNPELGREVEPIDQQI
jgi:hypothetical protein